MKFAVGCDHAGFAAKKAVLETLRAAGHEAVDLGTGGEQSVDYPDFALAVGRSVASGECPRGILVCGSGIGMAISANKVKGIRAALCWNVDIAKLSRQHNDANVLCLPGRFLAPEDVAAIVGAWTETAFEGGRHERRVQKICEIENDRC